MATNTQPAPFAETAHHLSTTGAMVILVWLVAAGAVAIAQTKLAPSAPAGGAAVTIAAILLAAYCYTRFCARHCGISHALGVGIAWLGLGTLTELLMATHLGRGCYAVLGSPDRPLLRNMLFFVWIFAPALFARREDAE